MSEFTAVRRLLLPLVPVYRLGLALREGLARSPQRLASPVVSIGNLSTGGVGKTPLTIALARALTRVGVQVDVISRGYGRKSHGVLRVDRDGTADEFGDEPLLIAREAEVPVYVAADRYAAGLLAEQESGAGVHLLDDGFQHHQLARAVDILILNRRDLYDRLLPAGNLREPVRALRRAQVIAIPSDEPELETELRMRGWPGPVWHLHRTMDVPQLGGPVVAFCGIARPEQFFTGLRAAGLNVVSRVAFRDHHRYVEHDIDCLRAAARTVGATKLITTEKDRARLGSLTAAISASLTLNTARLCVEIEDEATVIDWLLGQIGVC